MKRNLIRLLLAIFVIAGISSSSKAADFAEAGDVRAENGIYGVVFYYSGKPPEDAAALLKKLAAESLPGIAIETEVEGKTPPFLLLEEEKAPFEIFPVPGPEYFEMFGRGLKPKDLEALQSVKQATAITLVVPKSDIWKLGFKFTKLIEDYALKTDAYIWDSATRECFAASEWTKSRVDTWVEGQPCDIEKQITIHFYQPDEKSPYRRAITLGMEKFALPDVVVEQMIAGDARGVGNLINFVCQRLADEPILANPKAEIFKFDQLKSEKLKTELVATLFENSKKSIPLAILVGTPQEGDPDNMLLELDFRNGKEATNDERRSELLAGLWGSKDSIKSIKHDDEILKASELARKQLPRIHKMLEDGLEPGERVLVKAPFERDDKEGSEWMWVEVTSWPSGGEIQGILQNDPFYISKLKTGSKVTVHAKDLFDYILYKADGTQEGNETGKILEQREGPERTK